MGVLSKEQKQGVLEAIKTLIGIEGINEEELHYLIDECSLEESCLKVAFKTNTKEQILDELKTKI